MTVIMNMWYKSTITLLTVLLCVDAVQNHCRVVQPPQAHVTSVGSSVTLGCRFQLPANMTQFRIKWLYSSDSHAKCGSDLEVFQSGIVYPGDENKTEEDPEGRVRMVMGNSLCKLTLTSMERHYRGMYFCQVTVEIPELQQCCGNGTWVDIETRPAQEKVPRPCSPRAVCPRSHNQDVLVSMCRVLSPPRAVRPLLPLLCRLFPSLNTGNTLDLPVDAHSSLSRCPRGLVDLAGGGIGSPHGGDVHTGLLHLQEEEEGGSEPHLRERGSETRPFARHSDPPPQSTAAITSQSSRTQVPGGAECPQESLQHQQPEDTGPGAQMKGNPPSVVRTLNFNRVSLTPP